MIQFIITIKKLGIKYVNFSQTVGQILILDILKKEKFAVKDYKFLNF